MSKKAVLIINLGSPDNCSAKSIRKYLREFLNDPRVIDLPAIIRWPLVNLLIIPFRFKKTTRAYQQIWGDASPLIVISEEQQKALARKLGEDFHVELGMRYGSPSIPAALEKLKDYESITVIPLFPQYSSAATGSAIEAVLNKIAKQWNTPALKVVQSFYAHAGFIQAFANQIQSALQNKSVDKIIFSYHGLPERHINKSDCHAACDRMNACPAMSNDNQFCYRAQCYATTQLIANQVGLNQSQYVVSFQSRLGRTPWIKPYTDLVLPELIKQGVKKIAVVCPSFVTDCLETLEEVNIRIRKQWIELGGAEFTFIPCINAEPLWIDALAEIVSAEYKS